jgi:uncharacterized protein (TIGR03083 family)
MDESGKKTLTAKLTRARQEFLALVADLSQTEWQIPVYSEDQEWTIADILRHLTGAEASMTRLSEIIRDGGEGVPPDFDLARWNARGVQKTREKLPAELLAEMEKNRQKLFRFIDTLEDKDWMKSGRHGSLRIMSIEQIMNQIADHEFTHTKDIKRSLLVE